MYVMNHVTDGLLLTAIEALSQDVYRIGLRFQLYVEHYSTSGTLKSETFIGE